MMTDSPQLLGEKIRAARKQLKMTQAELAGSDFTKSFISQVEKGFARPSLKSLQILAARLNKPIGYFLGDDTGEGEEPSFSPKGERLLQSARSLARQGHLQDALTLYQDILSSTPKTERALRARAHVEMSQVLWNLDRKVEAIESLEEGLDLYRHLHDPAARARALSRLADFTAELNDMARAAAACEQALTILEEADVDNPTLELKLRTDAGLYLTRLNQHQRARRHLEQATELAALTDDYYRWGEICHAMGVIVGASGDLEGAITYSLRAIAFYEAVGNRPRKIQARINAASFYHQAGQREQALAQIEAALEEASSAQEAVSLAHIHQLRGDIAASAGNWPAAEEAFRAALALQDNFEARALLHRRLARALQEQDRLEEAVKEARAAVTLLERHRNTSKQDLAQAYGDLAQLLQAAGQVDEAQRLLLRSLNLFR